MKFKRTLSILFTVVLLFYSSLFLSNAAAAEDTDGDGIPDWWEIAFGTDPYVKDADKDPDGDGRTNLQEYLDGTHPLDGGHPPTVDGQEFPWWIVGICCSVSFLGLIVLLIVIIAFAASRKKKKSKKDEK
ncbi:MAG: hypothetical protein QCI82_01785 [Candidatus Thermoplasmatota archaeon]|nr:hypothetical protein [Candidatus Thermoplasmatota archaeon]